MWGWIGITVISERTNRLAELQTSLKAAADEKNFLLEQLRSESGKKAALGAELSQMRSSLEDQSVLRDRLKLEGELRVKAETQMAEARTNLEEQRKLLQESKAELSNTFSELSAEALNINNQAFLGLAKTMFETLQARAKGELQTYLLFRRGRYQAAYPACSTVSSITGNSASREKMEIMGTSKRGHDGSNS